MNEFNNPTDDESEMFARFKKNMTMQAARAQIRKIEYNLSDVTCGLSAIRSACADADVLQLGGVCVAPSFVKSCSAFLGPAAKRRCSLVACIGYPNGGDTTDIKVKAVKRAIKDGADEVEVTAPVAQIRDGNFQYVKREFKKLRKAAKNRSLRISAESDLFTGRDLTRLSMIAADCRVNCVKFNSSTDDTEEDKTIAHIRAAVKDKCTIKAEGINTLSEMSQAVDMGAVVVGSRNASAVARRILAVAESENLA